MFASSLPIDPQDLPAPEVLVSGGIVLASIATCAVVVVVLAVRRNAQLRRSQVLPTSTDDILKLVRSEEFPAAVELAKQVDAPSTRILLTGLRRRHMDLFHIERAMASQGRREYQNLRSKVTTFVFLSNLAPLLGASGTLLGIWLSWRAGTSEGMETALVTTLAGLIVAIPAWLLAVHFRRRVNRLTLDTDEKMQKAVELLTDPLLVIIED